MKCVLVVSLFILISSTHCKIEIEEVDEFDDFEEVPTTVRIIGDDVKLNENPLPIVEKVEAEVSVEVQYSFEKRL